MPNPTTRQIQALTAHGGPEVLRLLDEPLPPRAEHTVRIGVEAVGVNFADALIRRGDYIPGAPLDWRPGLEVAGRVLAGPHTGPAPGTAVAAFVDRDGYASVVDAPPDRVYPLPSGLSATASAAVLIQATTAYAAVHLIGRVAAGETVLVDAAGGGVGRHVLRIAADRGARVIAAASSADKLAAARAVGLDTVVLGRAPLKEQISGGVDVFIDSIGGPVLEDGLRSLRAGGRLVVVGAASLQPTALDTRRLIPRSLTISAFTLAGLAAHDPAQPRAIIEKVLELARDGRLDTSATTFGLADAAAAHRRLESRSHTGKLVLIPEAL